MWLLLLLPKFHPYFRVIYKILQVPAFQILLNQEHIQFSPESLNLDFYKSLQSYPYMRLLF
jgi:hypothetical protein